MHSWLGRAPRRVVAGGSNGSELAASIGRRTLQESGAEQTQRERSAHEHRRLSACQTLRVFDEFTDVLVFQALGYFVQLTRRLLDIAGNGVVLLVTQRLCSLSNCVRHTAHAIEGSILLRAELRLGLLAQSPRNAFAAGPRVALTFR